jgi:DNA-directed RNA polymerase subunit RPC12/RpoP
MFNHGSANAEHGRPAEAERPTVRYMCVRCRAHKLVSTGAAGDCPFCGHLELIRLSDPEPEQPVGIDRGTSARRS